MNVLFVSEYWPPNSQGGGEESAAVLAKALSKRGIAVTVLTSQFPGLTGEETQNSVRVLRRIRTGTSPGKFWSNVKRVLIFPFSARIKTKHLLCQEEFDAIHYVNVSSAMAKIRTEINSFVHVNSPLFFCPKGTLLYHDQKECHYRCTPLRFLECFTHSQVFGKMQNKWYYKYNPGLWITLYVAFRIRMCKLKKFNNYIAVSGFMQKKLLETGIPEKNTQIISNIVALPKIIKTHNKILVILYLGDYLRQKGVMELLSALKLVKGKYLCNFYGNGPIYGAMQEFVEKNNLQNVRINGRIPQEKVISTIATHDIVIQPSLIPEAISRTVLQAMAAGKAVITSNRGGMKDYITNNKEGLLIDPSNPKEIAKAIEKCLDKNISERMGRNARAKVKQTSSAEAVTDKFLLRYKNAKHLI